MNTQSYVASRLGHLDGVGGRAVMVQIADVDTTGTARADTGLRVPEGAVIVGIRALVGASRFTAATNLSIGHRLSDDAFAGNVALGTVANTTATFGDSQFSGKVAALTAVGGDTTIYTKLSRAQANADLRIQVSYINPEVDEDEAESKPLDVDDLG